MYTEDQISDELIQEIVNRYEAHTGLIWVNSSPPPKEQYYYFQGFVAGRGVLPPAIKIDPSKVLKPA